MDSLLGNLRTKGRWLDKIRTRNWRFSMDKQTAHKSLLGWRRTFATDFCELRVAALLNGSSPRTKSHHPIQSHKDHDHLPGPSLHCHNHHKLRKTAGLSTVDWGGICQQSNLNLWYISSKFGSNSFVLLFLSCETEPHHHNNVILLFKSKQLV